MLGVVLCLAVPTAWVIQEIAKHFTLGLSSTTLLCNADAHRARDGHHQEICAQNITTWADGSVSTTRPDCPGYLTMTMVSYHRNIQDAYMACHVGDAVLWTRCCY
jgi:hypothetical protein